MNQFFTLMIYIVFIFFSIYYSHQVYLFIQEKYVPKVNKLKYYTQHEKYDNIVKEVLSHEHDKIEMENDLNEFIEENLKQYK